MLFGVVFDAFAVFFIGDASRLEVGDFGTNVDSRVFDDDGDDDNDDDASLAIIVSPASRSPTASRLAVLLTTVSTASSLAVPGIVGVARVVGGVDAVFFDFDFTLGNVETSGGVFRFCFRSCVGGDGDSSARFETCIGACTAIVFGVDADIRDGRR